MIPDDKANASGSSLSRLAGGATLAANRDEDAVATPAVADVPQAVSLPVEQITGDTLQAFTLFRGLSVADLNRMAHAMTARRLNAGEVLFRQGDPGDSMFLVQRGRLRVFIHDASGNDITFRYFGEGQIVGEFALLDQKPRSASADAPEGATVMVFSRSAFDAFLKERPFIGITMMRGLAERIRYTTQYLERTLHAVELLQQHDYEHALGKMMVASDEESIQSMINAFLQMIRSVRDREEMVRRMSGRGTARAHVEVDVAEE